nr:MFS transporter [Paenibacillus hamazuiensis]
MHVYIFVFYSTQAVFLPFLGYWFAEQGLSSRQIGLLSSLGPVLGLFIQPVWGALCDRFGLERAILMASTVLAPLIAFGYRFAGDRFWMYMVTALGLALTFSAMSPINEAMTVSHAQKRGLSYGGIRVLGSISFAIVAALIGVIYKRIGIEHMFMVYAGTMALLLASLFLLEKPRIGKNRNRVRGGFKAFLSQRRFIVFLPLVFAVSVGSAACSVFLSVFVNSTGGDVSGKIGLLNTAAALSELPFFIFAGRLIKRFGYFPILSAVGAAAALRWLLLSSEPTFGMLIAAQLLHGVTFALFVATGISYVHEASPEGFRTTGQTLFAIVNSNLAVLVASNAGGYLIDARGFSFMFQTASLVSLAGAIGFAWLARSSARTKAEAGTGTPPISS